MGIEKAIENNARQAAEWDFEENGGPADDPLGLPGHFDSFVELLKSFPAVRRWAEEEDEYVIFYPAGKYAEAADLWKEAYVSYFRR